MKNIVQILSLTKKSFNHSSLIIFCILFFVIFIENSFNCCSCHWLAVIKDNSKSKFTNAINESLGLKQDAQRSNSVFTFIYRYSALEFVDRSLDRITHSEIMQIR